MASNWMQQMAEAEEQHKMPTDSVLIVADEWLPKLEDPMRL